MLKCAGHSENSPKDHHIADQMWHAVASGKLHRQPVQWLATHSQITQKLGCRTRWLLNTSSCVASGISMCASLRIATGRLEREELREEGGDPEWPSPSASKSKPTLDAPSITVERPEQAKVCTNEGVSTCKYPPDKTEESSLTRLFTVINGPAMTWSSTADEGPYRAGLHTNGRDPKRTEPCDAKHETSHSEGLTPNCIFFSLARLLYSTDSC